MAIFNDNTVVTIKGRGVVDAVVVRSRSITRGRYAGQREYTLAPLDFSRKGKPYFVTAHERWVHPCAKQYTEAEVQQALGTHQAVVEKRDRNQAARSERGWSAYEELVKKHGGINPGDEVLVGYRDGARWETVGSLRGDRVGILRRNAQQIRERNRDQEMVNYQLSQLSGVDVRRGKQREMRWLPTTIVKDVRKAGKPDAELVRRAGVELNALAKEVL